MDSVSGVDHGLRDPVPEIFVLDLDVPKNFVYFRIYRISCSPHAIDGLEITHVYQTVRGFWSAYYTTVGCMSTGLRYVDSVGSR